MSYYAVTLIIDKKTTLNDSKILESLNLYKLENPEIGKKNSNYQECLVDFNSTYVCSTNDFIIITGLPVIKEFTKDKNLFFQDLISDNSFFVFLSESVAMHHIICFGENKSYLRRKIVNNGNYIRNQEKSDQGELFDHEMYYFEGKKSFSSLLGSVKKKIVSNEEKLKNTSYLMGENDYDIALQIIRDKFPSLSFSSNSKLEDFFGTLEFNKNIDEELSEEYRLKINSKLNRGEIDKLSEKFFENKLKALGFKKELYKAPAPRNIGKNIRFVEKNIKYPLVIEYFNNELFQKFDFIIFINSILNFPKELETLLEQERYISLHSNYPFFSFQVSTEHRILNRSKDKIFVKSELDAVFTSFTEDFKVLDSMIKALTISMESFFTDLSLWSLAISKIDKSVVVFGVNEYKPELNYCIAYIYFKKDSNKLGELRMILEKTFDNQYKDDSMNLQERLDKLMYLIS
jgi:hypothetical protein